MAIADRRDTATQRDGFLARLAQGPAIMGILNVTPDSFSDGGRFDDLPAAVAQARRMAEEGADIVDIGAESTRPGHVPISAEEEWARLADILPAVRQAIALPLSLDTMKARVARQALAAGVGIINDIWGLQGDPDMAATVAEGGAGIVVMHNRREKDGGIDILADMHRFFERSLAIAREAGIPDADVVLDPGIGFGKTQEQNVHVLRHLREFHRHGRPLLVGVSRKSFLGALFGAPPEARLAGTLAANLDAIAKGARVLRVHDVREHVLALRVAGALSDGA